MEMDDDDDLEAFVVLTDDEEDEDLDEAPPAGAALAAPPPDADVEARVSALLDKGPCCEECCNTALDRTRVANVVREYLSVSKEEQRALVMTVLGVNAVRDNAHLLDFPVLGRICNHLFEVLTSQSERTRRRLQHASRSKLFFNDGRRNNKRVDTITRETEQLLRSFVDEVVSTSGIVRRVRESDKEPKVLLPSWLGYRRLYADFRNLYPQLNVSLGTAFYRMKAWYPRLSFRSPQQDTCETCFRLDEGVREVTLGRQRLVGDDEEDITERDRIDEEISGLRANMAAHLEEARLRRQEYRNDCTAAETAISTKSPEELVVLSFDFAQKVKVPTLARQPSQWYFTSVVQSSLFDIVDEGVGKHSFYFFPDYYTEQDWGAVLSVLYKYLVVRFNRALRPRRIVIWADNCPAQNKNYFVVGFLAVMTELLELPSVTLKFMVPGHTKFSPDRGFGSLKHALRGKNIFTVRHMVELVRAEAANHGFIGGADYVEMRSFLELDEYAREVFLKQAGIKGMHEMEFRADKPGSVRLRGFKRDIGWRSVWRGAPRSPADFFGGLLHRELRPLSAVREKAILKALRYVPKERRREYIERELICDEDVDALRKTRDGDVDADEDGGPDADAGMVDPPASSPPLPSADLAAPESPPPVRRKRGRPPKQPKATK